MFIPFLYALRERKVPVGTQEAVALAKALSLGLHEDSLDGFYYTARALLSLGPKYVLVKKGEHGSILFSERSIFLMPAYPLEEVQDPTGAGDTFAGGLMGVLASAGTVDEPTLRKAMVYGSVVASFGVEAFSLDRLQTLTLAQIETRAGRFRDMMRV